MSFVINIQTIKSKLEENTEPANQHYWKNVIKYYIPTHCVPLKKLNPFKHLHLQEPLVFMHIFLSVQLQ